MSSSGAFPAALILADWIKDFHSFSLQHLVSAGFFIGLIVLTIREGLRRRALPDHSERSLRRTWGIFILVYQAVETAWWLLPQNLSWEKSLPFALCDLAAWTAGIALLTEGRNARTLLYYWGLCLSSQAFFTPILHEGNGMGTPRFWFFFIGHTNIVGAAWYELIVGRYRPSWRDWAIAVVGSMCYVALIVPLNIGLDVNYGFMGPTDKQPGIVQFLPHWPWRVHGVIAGGFVLYTLATVPWRLVRRAETHHTPGGVRV